MAKVLSMLVRRYDRNAALLDGRVRPEGLELDIHEEDDDRVRQGLGLSGAYDVWEAFAGRYLMDLDAGRRAFTAIPVFVKRTFRHSAIYVRRGGPVSSPADLHGRRVGLQHWATTAAIWAKGILAEDYDVDLSAITWVQTSPEDVAWTRPPWLHLEQADDRRLLDLLLAGDVDAAITSEAWAPYENPALDFLFPNYPLLERAYFARTRIFPIMHCLLVRSSILDRYPWVAMRLFEAWSAAKQDLLDRLERDRSVLTSMWFRGLWEEERDAVGSKDTYPWGFGGTAHEVAKLIEYAWDQGLITRPYGPADLFYPSTLDT